MTGRRVEVSDACIGAGACEIACASVFFVNDDGFAEVHESEVPSAPLDELRAAEAGCPTAAITVSEEG